MAMLVYLEYRKKTEGGANLEGQNSPETEVVQFGLWRNSLRYLALYSNSINNHTLELLYVAV